MHTGSYPHGSKEDSDLWTSSCLNTVPFNQVTVLLDDRLSGELVTMCHMLQVVVDL